MNEKKHFPKMALNFSVTLSNIIIYFGQFTLCLIRIDEQRIKDHENVKSLYASFR